MGIYTNWIAVNTDDVTNVQTILKLSDTASLGLSSEDQKQEYNKYHVEAYLLESGWYVVEQWESFSEKNISDLSQKYDVIVFIYAESWMQSKAQYWRGQKLKWEVYHDNSSHETPCHLEYSVDMPNAFKVIKEKVETQNKKNGNCYDTIEIPILLVEKYLGQELNEFGRPKTEILTSYLSYDEPHILLKAYKPKKLLK